MLRLAARLGKVDVVLFPERPDLSMALGQAHQPRIILRQTNA